MFSSPNSSDLQGQYGIALVRNGCLFYCVHLVHVHSQVSKVVNHQVTERYLGVVVQPPDMIERIRGDRLNDPGQMEVEIFPE